MEVYCTDEEAIWATQSASDFGLFINENKKNKISPELTFKQ